MHKIINYSEAKAVSMADSWFDIATLEHFWIRRRFNVLARLLGKELLPSDPVAEVGCGHGLVQSQFKAAYGLDVDGFELNKHALEMSVATEQPRIIYDIHERRPDLAGKYQMIILFDVIEHIDDDTEFLESVLFHLNFAGLLAINVPALQPLFSEYDRAAGHVRRYSLQQLNQVCAAVGLKPLTATYWGLPLLPLLAIRKAVLAFSKGEKAVINQGFKPPSKLANALLNVASACEPIPQSLVGTSVMGIFRKPQK